MSPGSIAHFFRLFAPLILCSGLLSTPFAAADDWAPSPASVLVLPAEDELAQAIRARIVVPGPLSVRGVALDRAWLAGVYGQRNFAALWAGHPEWQTGLVAEIASSAQEGMSPASFDLAALQNALADPALERVDRELFLTDRFLAYAAALARGRVAPGAIETDWILPAPSFDPVVAVAGLVRDGDPTTALEALRPASPGYVGLRAALRRYLAFAAAGGWNALPVTATIDMGDQGQQVVELRRRLAAEGYLPPEQSEGWAVDIQLVGAVIEFQRHHGLSPDGRVGPLTIAALNVSVVDRVQQIRLNLERWRAMPRYWPRTRIEVAEPDQTLIYFRDGQVALTSRVIVGDPMHPSPVLAAVVEGLLLDPAWNVPASIVAHEIQPRLRRDPGYLSRSHMVILGRRGDDPYGRDVDWQSTSVLGSGWRLRQLPGPWNALGTVMLDMPNEFAVYLHDTPTPALFALPARALSHGCIRVEEVRSLAATLISSPSLPEPGGETRPVPLAVPVAVYLLYQTAFTAEDGAVEFRDDIYGRDRRLAAALADIDPAWGMPDTGAARSGGSPSIPVVSPTDLGP